MDDGDDDIDNDVGCMNFAHQPDQSPYRQLSCNALQDTPPEML